MILFNCPAGKTGYVETICLPAAMSRRLHMLGLTKGTQITVLRKKRCGTMIVKVRGVRYALGASCAEGIFVGDDGNE